MNLFKKSFARRRFEPAVHGAGSYAQFAKDAGYFVILALVASFLFLGCTDPDDIGNLNGTWLSYDSYIINTSTNKIEYAGNYKADIVNSPNYEATSGVLIIKFTWYYETIYDSTPPYNVISEGETQAYNGKYGAVYWRNLTPGSVEMANAYSSMMHIMFNNLSDAQTNFTLDKTGDYISMWGSYTK